MELCRKENREFTWILTLVAAGKGLDGIYPWERSHVLATTFQAQSCRCSYTPTTRVTSGYLLLPTKTKVLDGWMAGLTVGMMLHSELGLFWLISWFEYNWNCWDLISIWLLKSLCQCMFLGLAFQQNPAVCRWDSMENEAVKAWEQDKRRKLCDDVSTINNSKS